MNITDEGALLVKVNRHKKNYDGTVCLKPNSYECGANQWFRQNNCARGKTDCHDINLFNNKDPQLIKQISEDDRPLFKKQIELLNSGLNPIMFFFTNAKNRYDYTWPMVGAYIVKEIQLSEGFYKDEVYIYPAEIINLPLDSLMNEYLWTRSTENSRTNWCREVYPSAVFPFLEIMTSKIQEYGNDESFEQNQRLAMLIESVSTSDSNKKVISVDIVNSQPLNNTSKANISNTVGEAPLSNHTFIINELKERFDQETVAIVDTAAKAGFYYSPDQVANLHNSLLTNPFLILSGISGGGKTSFALFYAQALKAKIQVVSVRPDWTNPSHLLGFYDPFAKDFIPSETTRFIHEAWQVNESDINKPQLYILLLDEMNLARVEYYFSDFLSKMQLPNVEHRVIHLYEEKEGDYPRELRIPPNLKIIGTVNIDESTFLFSSKVLDRASYILLNDIDIEGMGRVLSNRADDCNHLPYLSKIILPELKVLNAKLTEFEHAIGYRTIWEMIRWIDSALTIGIITDPYEGLDMQVETRILSKISGGRRDGLFQGLRSYFQDRTDPQREGRYLFERSLTRLESLIERAEREEYALGQQ